MVNYSARVATLEVFTIAVSSLVSSPLSESLKVLLMNVLALR